MKKLLSLALASVFACACMGCVSAPKYEDLPKYQADTPFRFAAYMTPPPANVGIGDLAENPDYMTDEQYGWMADCGFDYAYAIYESTLDHVQTALDLCEKYGIKYMVADKGGAGDDLNFAIAGGADEGSTFTQAQKDSMSARWDTYRDHPAFAGHVAFDEPSAKLYDRMREVKDFYEEELPDKEFYVNLLPITGEAQLGAPSYQEYVESFLEKVEPEMLSYDKYSLLKDPTNAPMLAPDHLLCLEHNAQLAKANGLPLYVFLLTMGHWSYRTPSNYDDLAWQLYTSMAYGAKGAQTFTYWTTMSKGEQITHGLVDWYGNRTQTWYSMQTLIEEVRAMEDIYLNFDWEETLTYTADEDYPNNMFESLTKNIAADKSSKDPVAGIVSLEGTQDYIIGRFTGPDATGNKINGYMLANAPDPALDMSNEITVKFEGASKVMVCKKGRTETFRLKNGKYTTTLGSGEGQFVIPLA